MRASRSTRRRPLATTLVVALSAAVFAFASSAGAVTGPVEAQAVGLQVNVSLLGRANVHPADQPTANYPAGPVDAHTTDVAVPNVTDTGVVTAHAEGDLLAATATATAQVAGANLLGSVVAADAVAATCTTDSGTASGSATLANAKAAGLTLPANPAPNTVVQVGGELGVSIATLTLNEQTTTLVAGVRTITVNALHLRLLGGLGSIGSGDVVLGHVSCSSTPNRTPAVTGLTPVEGPTRGGTTVTIDGSDFTGVDEITFGGTPSAFTRISDTRLSAVTPAHAAGPVSVRVANAAGAATASGTFTYRAAPAVSGLNPDTGPASGGTSVSVTGSGFTGASRVAFGAATATYTVVSDTQITTTSPAGTGSVPVTITTGGGRSADAAAAYFTYLQVPALTALTPPSGPTGGGTPITLTGTGFTAGSTVTVGGVPVPVTVVDPGTLRVVSPAHAAGAVAVVVTTAGGTTAPQTFTYVVLPTVTSLAPPTGPDTGGTPVVISGEGLDGVTAVTLDGATVALTSQTPTSIHFTTAAHAEGPAGIVLIGPGVAHTPAGSFTFVDATPTPGAPVVTRLDAATGLAGDTVTITGSGFTGATAAAFGNVPVTNGAVVSDTEITVTVPSNLGEVTVRVGGPGGISSASPGSTFTYTPVLTSISPAEGLFVGGTAVTLHGSNFTPTSTLTGDGGPTPVTYVSDTELTLTTPPHAAGDVAVVVHQGVASSASRTFTFRVLPSVSLMSPTSGPTSGGTLVSLLGVDLDDLTAVQVDGVPATLGSSLVPAQFTTPAHAAGPAAVTYTVAGAVTLSAGTFVYVTGGPGITALTPAAGPLVGGTAVTMTGSGLGGATLTVGGVPTSATIAPSGDSLTFTTPAGVLPGSVPVVVSTAGGTASGVFTYLAPPSIATLTPSTGPVAGGGTVTIAGPGLSGVSAVTFGGVPATDVTVRSPTSVTVTAPAHVAGPVAVVVTGPGGSATLAYWYVDPPAVSSIAPATGPAAGGTSVTVTGTGFTGTTAVLFGATPALSVVVQSPTSLRVSSPAHLAGPVAVRVVTSGGSSAQGPGGVFTYVGSPPAIAPATPAITAVRPPEGPVGGGTDVTITGSGFTGATAVLFDGSAGTRLTVVDDTTITVASPAHQAGGVDVQVVVAQRTSTTGAAARFTYSTEIAAPVVTGLSPSVGLTGGGTNVTITGSSFGSVTGVLFGNQVAPSFRIVDDTTVVATSPPATAGPVDVRVTGSQGTSAVVAADTFTYVATFEDAALSVPPADALAGSSAGGVTIRHANLDRGTRVTFGGAADTVTLRDDETGTRVHISLASFHGNRDGAVRSRIAADTDEAGPDEDREAPSIGRPSLREAPLSIGWAVATGALLVIAGLTILLGSAEAPASLVAGETVQTPHGRCRHRGAPDDDDQNWT